MSTRARTPSILIQCSKNREVYQSCRRDRPHQAHRLRLGQAGDLLDGPRHHLRHPALHAAGDRQGGHRGQADEGGLRLRPRGLSELTQGDKRQHRSRVTRVHAPRQVDWYTLGVLAFELVTGSPPCPAPTKAFLTSTLGVSRSKSSLCGIFVWAHRALNARFRWVRPGQSASAAPVSARC